MVVAPWRGWMWGCMKTRHSTTAAGAQGNHSSAFGLCVYSVSVSVYSCSSVSKTWPGTTILVRFGARSSVFRLVPGRCRAVTDRHHSGFSLSFDLHVLHLWEELI